MSYNPYSAGSPGSPPSVTSASDGFESEDAGIAALIANIANDFKLLREEEDKVGADLKEQINAAVKEYYGATPASGKEANLLRAFFQGLDVVVGCFSEEVRFKKATTFKAEARPANLAYALEQLFRRLPVNSSLKKNGSLASTHSRLIEKIKAIRVNFAKRYHDLIKRCPEIRALMAGHTTGMMVGALARDYMGQSLTTALNRGVDLISPVANTATNTTHFGASSSAALGASGQMFSNKALEICDEAIAISQVHELSANNIKREIENCIKAFFKRESSVSQQVQNILLDHFSGVEVQNSCCSSKCRFSEEFGLTASVKDLNVLAELLDNLIENLCQASTGCCGRSSAYESLINRLITFRNTASQNFLRVMEDYRSVQEKLAALYTEVNSFERGRALGGRRARRDVLLASGTVADATVRAATVIGMVKSGGAGGSPPPATPFSAAGRGGDDPDLRSPLIGGGAGAKPTAPFGYG